MAFPLKDVRFTSRRSEGALTLYPRLVRDRSFLPKVDITVQYFESMLGRERRELDTEVLVHFFGDPKLTRCMVACLARSYRFRARRFGEIVTRTALRRLERAGVDTPRALRFKLYDHLNDFGHGFLKPLERDPTLGTLEQQFGLRAGELERLLYLDADEHAVLSRVGDEPAPADVVAQYNLRALTTVLRHAEQIELTLARWGRAETDALLALCAANGVEARLTHHGTSTRLCLFGRQDALGGWSRHGRRLARTVLQMLERARVLVTDGLAVVALRDRRGVVRLTPELLDVLVGAPAPSIGWDDVPGWDQGSLNLTLAAIRAPGPGWGVRRQPDPQAWASGLILPDLFVQAGERRLFICAVRSAAHAARLAPIVRTIATGEPYAFLGDPSVLGPLQVAGAHAIPVESSDPPAFLRGLQQATDTPARAPATAQIA